MKRSRRNSLHKSNRAAVRATRKITDQQAARRVRVFTPDNVPSRPVMSVPVSTNTMMKEDSVLKASGQAYRASRHSIRDSVLVPIITSRASSMVAISPVNPKKNTVSSVVAIALATVRKALTTKAATSLVRVVISLVAISPVSRVATSLASKVKVFSLVAATSLVRVVISLVSRVVSSLVRVVISSAAVATVRVAISSVPADSVLVRPTMIPMQSTP